MKLKFSRQIFEKYTNIKFQENLSSANRVVPCGQTDGYDEANSSLSQFCERALKKRSPSPFLFSKDKEYNYMDKPIFAPSGELSVALICSESWK